MTDEAYVLLLSNKERKNNGVFHQKKGSRSKSCHLPQDFMTEREMRKMNGPITITNPNKTFDPYSPLTYDDMKHLPLDVLSEHITHLRDIGASRASIARHINVSPVVFKTFLMAKGITVDFPSSRPTIEQMRAVEQFYTPDTPESNNVPANEAKEAVPENAYVTPVSDMTMAEFSLVFNGNMDVDMIANSLRQMTNRNASYRVTINVVKEN